MDASMNRHYQERFGLSEMSIATLDEKLPGNAFFYGLGLASKGIPARTAVAYLHGAQVAGAEPEHAYNSLLDVEALFRLRRVSASPDLLADGVLAYLRRGQDPLAAAVRDIAVSAGDDGGLIDGEVFLQSHDPRVQPLTRQGCFGVGYRDRPAMAGHYHQHMVETAARALECE